MASQPRDHWASSIGIGFCAFVILALLGSLLYHITCGAHAVGYSLIEEIKVQYRLYKKKKFEKYKDPNDLMKRLIK